MISPDTVRELQMNDDAKGNEDHTQDNPSVTNVVERNIRTLIQLRMQAGRVRSFQDRIADAITAFSGRMAFVYVHIVWFGAWILLNEGLFGMQPFDPFPYGLLTTIVSLEAIFLSTFVLISQNRFTAEAERRAELDLHINLLAEHELTRALQMLQAIHDKLGIEVDEASEVASLATETKPEDVLAEIDRLKERASAQSSPFREPTLRGGIHG